MKTPEQRFRARLKAQGKKELRNVYVKKADGDLIKANKPEIQKSVDDVISKLKSENEQ